MGRLEWCWCNRSGAGKAEAETDTEECHGQCLNPPSRRSAKEEEKELRDRVRRTGTGPRRTEGNSRCDQGGHALS